MFLCMFCVSLQLIKQFLLLSKRRSALTTQCLIDSETCKPNFMPRLYINRRLAMEHRDNPSLDPSCKNTVFTQVPNIGIIKCCYSKIEKKIKTICWWQLYSFISFKLFSLFQVFEGLKPSDKFEKTLDYRLDMFSS